jgi:serine/threonine protein kinase
MIKSLDYPHIAKFFWNFENANKLDILIEYIEGKYLYSFLQRRKNQNLSLTESFIIKFLSQLLSDVQYFHDQNINHVHQKSQYISNFNL